MGRFALRQIEIDELEVGKEVWYKPLINGDASIHEVLTEVRHHSNGVGWVLLRGVPDQIPFYALYLPVED